MRLTLLGKVMSNINSKMLTKDFPTLQVTGLKYNGLILKMVRINLFIIDIEHFIVWMRTAGLPNFRKLWGRIDDGLEQGQYSLTIVNKYDVSQFDGKKSYVFSTTNALGGKNYFLAICYLVVGSLCIVFAIIFCIAFLRKKNSKRND